MDIIKRSGRTGLKPVTLCSTQSEGNDRKERAKARSIYDKSTLLNKLINRKN